MLQRDEQEGGPARQGPLDKDLAKLQDIAEGELGVVGEGAPQEDRAQRLEPVGADRPDEQGTI